MKKFLLKVTSGPEYSFSISNEECSYFYDEFHYHPEFELTLILKGDGTRFIGDSVERYTDGDLVLVGSNLPHVWKSSEEYYSGNSTLKCCSLVIHFAKNFLGSHFFDLPEFKSVKVLFEEASGGIQIQENLRNEISNDLLGMLQLSQTERLIRFLDILRKISISKERRILSSSAILNAYLPNDNDRIKKVHQFIVSNFKKSIRLEDVAHHASMTPNAFCRYFKQRTRKTFSTFINEIRVAYACQLLEENKMKISQICFECGFTNLSNFNVQFKNIMKKTPQQYSMNFKNMNMNTVIFNKDKAA